jgi:folate-binding protein YgfZ
MTPGYRALTEGAGIIDLSARGRIKVTGEDRARLLHAMTTNHVQQMKPGEGLYAFFLNAQGRIQADVYVYCHEDHFLLDTEPETRQLVYDHLDHYIIADDVELEDVTGSTFCLGLEGPSALTVASGSGTPAASVLLSHVAWGGVTVAAVSGTGEPGLRFFGPPEQKDALEQTLATGGAVKADAHDLTQVRIRHFKPRFGDDISESTLPQETQQMHALHFQKGCYLGQEIVERIRSRGHVNRQLMGFKIESHASEDSTPITPGMKLFAGGKEAGEVTSAIVCPEGCVCGLAYVRLPYNKPGSTVGIEGRPAELFPPFGA